LLAFPKANRQSFSVTGGNQARRMRGEDMSDLAFLSATALAAKVAAKEISAVELLQMYLQRVDTHNPQLRPYKMPRPPIRR
jgi:hypothetical protein